MTECIKRSPTNLAASLNGMHGMTGPPDPTSSRTCSSANSRDTNRYPRDRAGVSIQITATRACTGSQEPGQRSDDRHAQTSWPSLPDPLCSLPRNMRLQLRRYSNVAELSMLSTLIAYYGFRLLRRRCNGKSVTGCRWPQLADAQSGVTARRMVDGSKLEVRFGKAP